MKRELDEMLCQRHPKIFVNRNGNMKTTAMCWGFECGDGWYNVIDGLCLHIQRYIDHKKKEGIEIPQVVADQVKEKFGTLRFYVSGGDDVTFWMIRLAEHYSERTCEGCGIPSKVSSRDGWLSNVCPVCIDLREQERARRAKENGFEL
jgi:hypothetical protein